MMTVGSLFTGIGGLDLGLERAGMQVRWQCEIDDYCQQVLRKHWPDGKLYGDIRVLDAATERVDLICGGFPCQPISQAAARSERGEGWMWPEFARVIDLLEPAWVVIENTESLRYANRGLSELLGSLAGMGFDAEWRVVRASDFGAPHKRARVWVVAHANQDSESTSSINDEAPILSEPLASVPGWGSVPDLRVDDGFSDWILRRQRLGNAVVPAVAEWVGRCVMKAAT